MPINIGTEGVGRILVGTSAVGKVYAGTDLVWSRPSSVVDQSTLSGFSAPGEPYDGAVVLYYDSGDNGNVSFADAVVWETPADGESTLQVYTSSAKTDLIFEFTTSTDLLGGFYPHSGSTDPLGGFLTQDNIDDLISISSANGTYLSTNRLYVIPITHTTLTQ